MSLDIVQKIYEKLEDDFSNAGLSSIEIRLIKDMIHAEGDMGVEKVIK